MILAMALGRTPDELLDTISAVHLQQYRTLYEEHCFGPVADDWRAALVMSAFNGQSPAENLPKWEKSQESAPILEISFAEACKALKRKG